MIKIKIYKYTWTSLTKENPVDVTEATSVLSNKQNIFKSFKTEVTNNMKKFLIILMAACHIYSLTINVDIIVGQSQSVLVQAEGGFCYIYQLRIFG